MEQEESTTPDTVNADIVKHTHIVEQPEHEEEDQINMNTKSEHKKKEEDLTKYLHVSFILVKIIICCRLRGMMIMRICGKRYWVWCISGLGYGEIEWFGLGYWEFGCFLFVREIYWLGFGFIFNDI